MSNGNHNRRRPDDQPQDDDQRHLHLHFHHHGDFNVTIACGQQQDDTASQRHREIMAALTDIKEFLVSTKTDILKNLQDIRDVNALYLQYIKDLDTRNAEKDAKIAALVKDVADGKLKIDDLQAAIDEVTSASQSVEDDMRASLPGVPPVGGNPLLPGYASVAEFNTAVSAYTGPEKVNLDGGQVKDGTEPALDYFSHSADGSVNTTGPTD